MQSFSPFVHPFHNHWKDSDLHFNQLDMYLLVNAQLSNSICFLYLPGHFIFTYSSRRTKLWANQSYGGSHHLKLKLNCIKLTLLRFHALNDSFETMMQLECHGFVCMWEPFTFCYEDLLGEDYGNDHPLYLEPRMTWTLLNATSWVQPAAAGQWTRTFIHCCLGRLCIATGEPGCFCSSS